MEVNWITLVAQLLNFVILVLLLRHFLYRRIVDAVERRREDIETRLEEANQREQEAEVRAEKLEGDRQQLEEGRQEILDAAKAEVAERRERMLQSAKEEVEHARMQWRRGLRRQQDSFLRDLRDRAASATWAAVERALHDLANDELQGRVVEVFADRLEEAASDNELVAVVREADEIIVRGSRELSGGQQERLASLIRDRFGARVEPEFAIFPELLVGVQLEVGDRLVGWSGREYLAALEEEVLQLLGTGEAESEEEPQQKEAEGHVRKSSTPATRDERVETAASAEEASGGRTE